MKYFFLSEGWDYSRVWEEGGLWDITVWRRKPNIKRLTLGMVEQGQVLWLYQVEDAVLMIEVKPIPQQMKSSSTIGQVVIKRLINSEEVIQRLINAQAIIN
jgi:hypothetical protein